MWKSKKSIEFENYLKSIGGLKNGFFDDKPPITGRYFFSIGDGWLLMVKELIEKIIDKGWNKEVCQVKEKFGSLRFYINSASKEVHDLINEYENKSLEICESCGVKGELRKNGWWRTLCDTCNEKNNKGGLDL